MANNKKIIKSAKLYHSIESYISMFKDCENLEEVDLKNVKDIENIRYTANMFKNCNKLESVDVTTWDTNNVSIIEDMFSGCPKSCLGYFCPGVWKLPTSGEDFDITWVAPFNAYTIDKTLLESNTVQLYKSDYNAKTFTYWGDGTYNSELTHTYDLDSIPGNEFTIYTTLVNNEPFNLIMDIVPNTSSQAISSYIPVSNLLVENSYSSILFKLTNGSYSSDIETEVQNVERIYINYNLDKINYISFNNMTYLKSIDGLIIDSRWTSIDNLFNGCANLESASNINIWNLENVTSAKNAFTGCSKLEQINLSTLSTNKLTSYQDMFLGLSDKIDWNYDFINNNYSNWHLTEEQTSFSFIFPWNYVYIEYTASGNRTVDGEYAGPTVILDDDTVYSINHRNTVIYLKTGGVTSDVKTSLEDTEKIRVYYPKYIKRLYFDYSYDNEISIYNSVRQVNHMDLSGVQTLNGAFEGCIQIQSIDLSNTRFERLTNIKGLFRDCDRITTINLENVIFEQQITDMSYLFSNCSKLENVIGLSNLQVNSAVTALNNMFENCSLLPGIPELVRNWNTRNVTNMSYMFCNCDQITSLDLSNWDVSKVTDMYSMFYSCNNLTSLNISTWDTRSLPDTFEMFRYVPAELDWGYVEGQNYQNVYLNEFVTMYSGTFPWFSDGSDIDENSYVSYTITPKSSSDTITAGIYGSSWSIGEGPYYVPLFGSNSTKATSMQDESCIPTKYIRIYSADGTEITDLNTTVNNIAKVKVYIPKTVNLISFNNYNKNSSSDHICYVTSIEEFKSPYLKGSKNLLAYTRLTTVDTTNWQLPNLKIIHNLFYNCVNLASAKLTLPNITDATGVFSSCSNLTSIDLSNWNSSSVTTMQSMFSGCSKLTSINLSTLNTTNLTDMGSMFYYCQALTSVDLSNFNTSKVTDMSYLFYYCTKLASINLSSFDTSKVTGKYSASNMFSRVPTTCVCYYDSSKWTLPAADTYDIIWTDINS